AEALHPLARHQRAPGAQARAALAGDHVALDAGQRVALGRGQGRHHGAGYLSIPLRVSRLQRVLLGAVLLSALVLRAVGLDQDLRRGSPTPDELSNFAGPVLAMWEARSPDPTVNGGYPGLFNWLAFLPLGLGARLGGEAGAVLGGRVMVAAFSTLNVLLVFLLVRPAFGPGAGLLGAALLAVSRSEVSEAHFLTPDVLVVSAFLLMLILARRAGASGLGPGVCA